MTTFTGHAHVYGDNIDTDRIIPGKYTKTLDTSHLAAHVLEDLDPAFSQRVQPGDILVAGSNFGSGSSREQAPIAIKASGIAVVVARSFARIFFRNAINIGLPLVELPDHGIEDGAQLQVDLIAGRVVDLSNSREYDAVALPPVMMQILQTGGLVDYLREFGRYDLKLTDV